MMAQKIKKQSSFLTLLISLLTLQACGIYSFTGASIPAGTETFQVNFFEGEIVEYAITPMSATAQNTAAQNRLTITINVRYFNVKNEEDNYEKRFSFFYDFPAEQQLYDIKDTAHNDIFDRITQDIFNASLAKW
jgi:hypothetical protein